MFVLPPRFALRVSNVSCSLSFDGTCFFSMVNSRAKVLVLYPDAIELHIRRVYDIQSVLFAEDSEIILGLWSEGEEVVGVHVGKEMVW